MLSRVPGRPRVVAPLLILLAGVVPARAQEVFVANLTNSITVFNRTDSGDVLPQRTLSGASTGLNGPRGIALDIVHDELFVANFVGNSITVYARTASGDTAPSRTISGDKTLLDFPYGIAVDLANDELIVTNSSASSTPGNASILIFGRTASGNAAPVRNITGAATGLYFSHHMAFDPSTGEIIVVNPGDLAPFGATASITVHDRTANGNVAPLRTLTGTSTGLNGPVGLALDRTNDEIVVANGNGNSVTVYARTASGDTAPLRTIAGGSTGLNFPVSAHVNPVDQELIVSNQSSHNVLTWGRTATGNVASIRILGGPHTGIYGPGSAILPAGLIPQPMAVDAAAVTGSTSNHNGVLEPGETVQIAPVWQNTSTIPESFGGTASTLTGPPGPTYTIGGASADYATVSGGAASNCASAPGGCYLMTISGTRPAVHWDATFSEDLGAAPTFHRPSSSGLPTKTWTLHVGGSFTDVPLTQPFYKKIETMLHTGITSGCAATTYCPGDTVSRGQMAIFIAKAIAGGGGNVPASGMVGVQGYNCTAGGNSLFSDVAPTDQFCKHAHYLAAQNVTLGCSAGKFCPADAVTRDSMASFIAKGIVAPGGGAAVPQTYGPDPVTGLSYSCDPASPNVHFSDVSVSNSFCKHIHYLWAKAIVSGCNATGYCPADPVSRDAMAKFIANGFNLQLYGP